MTNKAFFLLSCLLAWWLVHKDLCLIFIFKFAAIPCFYLQTMQVNMHKRHIKYCKRDSLYIYIYIWRTINTYLRYIWQHFPRKLLFSAKITQTQIFYSNSLLTKTNHFGNVTRKKKTLWSRVFWRNETTFDAVFKHRCEIVHKCDQII